MKNKIRVIGKIVLNQKQKQRLIELGADFFAEHNPERFNEDEIVKLIDNAEIIINNISTPITKNVIDRCPSIKFIQTWSSGTDNIDVDYAKKKKIEVMNVKEYCTNAVAEKTIALLLIATHRLIEANKSASNGKWEYQKFTGTELKNKKLLLIGEGHISKRVAELATAFGMKVCSTNSSTTKKELYSIISDANFISIHCPLNDSTKNLISTEEFKLMNNCVMVNTSRGGIINEEAMLNALENGSLKFVALDVLAEEPPSKNNPVINHPKIFVTPHCAWNTGESLKRLSDVAVKNIETFITKYNQELV